MDAPPRRRSASACPVAVRCRSYWSRSRSNLACGELWGEIERHNRVQRRLDMNTGAVRLEPAWEGGHVTFDGITLITAHGPGLRLLIIGGGQLSRYLASMAVMLGY